MRRRELIALLGGAAAWPLAARAQQGERMRRVGVLMHSTSDEPEAQARIAEFLQGLQGAGWEVGRNVRVDTRWSSGDAARLRKNAADLIALSPDVVSIDGVAVTPETYQSIGGLQANQIFNGFIIFGNVSSFSLMPNLYQGSMAPSMPMRFA